jgi:2-C-methyl-D-erythritol 2,4-cyclodiphosphate synthase
MRNRGGPAVRVGIGRDLHRLERGRCLVLGGVVVSEHVGCVAHSDGDCLVHALIDSMLGALAMPNIGVLFPNSEDVNSGRRSLDMLAEVGKIVAMEGYALCNADAVVMLESVKLSPFIDEMRLSIAQILDVDREIIGIKATTAEGLGQIGAGKAVEVICTCLLERLPS